MSNKGCQFLRIYSNLLYLSYGYQITFQKLYKNYSEIRKQEDKEKLNELQNLKSCFSPYTLHHKGIS